MAQKILDEHPRLLAFSNYSWNLELSYQMSVWAKKQIPDLVVVFGGPNFPVSREEKLDFLMKRPAVDFYIENEGELGFVDLLGKLQSCGLDQAQIKRDLDKIRNCSYLSGDKLVEGGIERIKDLDMIPSPYLSGLMDDFFDMPLVPMMETTRGCPFSCTFCADGIASKNKVARFRQERVRDELNYISERVKDVDELIITDLNFGMYKSDIDTAYCISEVQRERNWPLLVKASAGKNRPERIINVAEVLKGSWVIGSSIQSSDQEVLKNVSRSNISLAAYAEFTEYMNNLGPESTTHTEIILGLPGDTKEKHFQSLRYSIDSQVRNVRMYQAIMLPGTEMATNHTREKYELLTKWRIIPGGVGAYQFGDEPVRVAEMEEIIVGSKDMPFEDYVACRVMNLLLETFVNNALSEEIFSALRAMNIPVFNFMEYIYEHPDLYSPHMTDVLSSYVMATKYDLFDTRAEAEEVISSPGLFERYLSGELGSNELLDHKARLFMELEDTFSVLIAGLKKFLSQNELLSDQVENYFDELALFMQCRKKDIQGTDSQIEQAFHYSFDTIAESNYQIDPRHIARSRDEIRFKFYHDQPQRTHIQNAVNLYAHHPGGIGRMLQRNNLRMMYRRFARVN